MDIKALIKNPKSYLIGVVLIFTGDKVWGYIEKGAEADFKDTVIQIVKAESQKAEFMQGVMTSPYMIDYKAQQTKLTVERIIKRDTNRVGLRSIIGIGTGIRNEFVSDTIVDVILDRRKPRVVGLTEAQCIELIKKYYRKTIRL